MTYGRSVGKALDTFGLDHKHNKWPELAADRLAWRAMLRSGEPPPDQPRAERLRPPPPLPIALTRPKRPMAATNAAIKNSMQQLAVRRRSTRDATHAARRDPCEKNKKISTPTE